jgi:hypothetical protein
VSYEGSLTENQGVERLKIEELPRPSQRIKNDVPSFHMLPDEIAPKPIESEPVAAQTARLLEAYKLLGATLSARLLLLLSISGAFVLSIMAMVRETTPALLVLIAWCLLTIFPTVALELKRRG